MSKPTFEPIAVDVIIADNGFSSAERSLLESRVADEALGLIQDLRLPAVAQVRLVDRTQNGRHGSTQITIAIEGQLCRQPMSSPYGEHKSGVNELANFGSSVLYANRHLLLTERVWRAIAKAYPAYVVGLVPTMVRRGFSLEVAEAIAGKIPPSIDVESRHYQVELLLSDFAPETLTVEVGESFYREIGLSQFSKMIGMMRDGLFYDLGVKFPAMRLDQNKTLSTFDFRVHFWGLRGPIFTGLATGEFLVNAAAPVVEKTLKIDARPTLNPVTGIECAIVRGEDAVSRCEREMKLTTWDAAGYAVLVIAYALRANAELFLTATNVQTMLAKLSEAFPLLIVNLLERFAPIFVLDVLRALVCEGFSIRDLRGVLEAMLDLNGAISHVTSGEIAILQESARLSYCEIRPTDHHAPKHCAESVRVAMRRYVTSQFAKLGDVTVLEISEPTEARLRGYRGWIRGREHESIVGAIAAASKDKRLSRPLVLLTAIDLRRRIREATEIEFPCVAVVCREELEERIDWRDHRHISWPGDEDTLRED